MTKKEFVPPEKILKKYAEVLVGFALNSGKGIKKDEVVYLVAQLPGIRLARAVYEAILAHGGHPLLNIIDDDFRLLHVTKANSRQLSFFPQKYYRGLADEIHHWVRILADRDPLYLSKADPKKVIAMTRSIQPFRAWLDTKEDKGKFTWTLCTYGTAGCARAAGLSLEEYWDQICRACFLYGADPLSTWKNVFSRMRSTLASLNRLPIVKLHVTAKHTDLWITLGKQRRWLGGSGRNIPSFEIFTSPDWRGTNGRIFFDLPLYRYGNIIRNISLEFVNGRIVRARAGKNEALLHAMIAQKNADKIGEFSLTDSRFSNITKFMADSLYDENFGGRFGNTHLAVGKSYHDTYAGDASRLSEKEFENLGFNHSAEHTDIIATTDRTVTAVLRDGSRKMIYENGHFTL
jgi:aminopeptidase